MTGYLDHVQVRHLFGILHRTKNERQVQERDNIKAPEVTTQVRNVAVVKNWGGGIDGRSYSVRTMARMGILNATIPSQEVAHTTRKRMLGKRNRNLSGSVRM